MTDKNKIGDKVGAFIAWGFGIAIVWILFLGVYALTQWTVRAF